MSKHVRERRTVPSVAHFQYAALPYRGGEKSELEVMLITSRQTRRWIIPKGWPKSGMPPHLTAAEEAFEEAGVAGKISKRPIGSYSYDKILEEGNRTRCSVRVFALRVVRQHKKWPEKRTTDCLVHTHRSGASRPRAALAAHYSQLRQTRTLSEATTAPFIDLDQQAWACFAVNVFSSSSEEPHARTN